MCPDLSVTVSVFSRFHGFDLARQLQRAGALARLITTYPRFVARRWELPPGKVSSVPHLELLARAWNKGWLTVRWQHRVQLWLSEEFDRTASRRLPAGSNVFVGWSSFSLQAIRRAKALGMKTVVERGSTHVAAQTELLREEYRRWGLEFTGTPESIQEREAQEYAEADRIAVPSLFARRSFLERGFPPEKLLHLPYGVSLERFFPVPKEDKVFRVMHCGAIGPRKGIRHLLQAFRELALPDAELWLVGRVEPEARKLLARHDDDRVVYQGMQSQHRLNWFYSQCSVFCLASVEEGFGLAIPQAMACGLPVIHSTNTGGADVVEDGVEGFSVPVGDVAALKEKILRLYEDPELRAEMGRKARARAGAALSWEQYGASAIAAYRALLASGGPEHARN